jgi:hypothetical protein
MILFRLFQCLENPPRITDSFIRRVLVQGVWDPPEMEFFQTQIIAENSQARGHCNLEMPTKDLARRKRSFSKHRANRLRKIMSQRPSRPGILRPFREHLLHFLTRARASPSRPYTASSPATICPDFNPLRVRNHTPARSSMDRLSVQTYIE